jgi:aromatic ring-opening dioxygenase catalytic subunit (LigB family)
MEFLAFAEMFGPLVGILLFLIWKQIQLGSLQHKLKPTVDKLEVLLIASEKIVHSLTAISNALEMLSHQSMLDDLKAAGVSQQVKDNTDKILEVLDRDKSPNEPDDKGSDL